MQSIVLVSKYTAIKQLIYIQLINALSIYTQDIKIGTIEDRKIPLYKDRDESRVLYTSGMALRLAKSHNQQPMEIASAILSYLSETFKSSFITRIVPPGWIYLELSHHLLKDWLQNLAVGNLGGEERKREEILIPNSQCQISHPASLFAMQYAHARCCSLVLLAHREGLILLREPLPDTSPAFWNVVSPEHIPWLNSDQKLRLNHPDEGCLISELVKVVDGLGCSDFNSAVNWEKAGLNLSQAFENFWCKCRIWGEVKISSPTLAQARLGLVMATQSVLRFLLVEKLGVFAPLEL